MSRPRLPGPVATLAGEVAALPGVVAVVLGGSRAPRTHRPTATGISASTTAAAGDRLTPTTFAGWATPATCPSSASGGPIVNGGAWLTLDDTPVDILFRDLDTVESWMREAEEGRFEVLSQNGYLVGAPTYLPVGELAISQPIAGELPRPRFPEPLAATATRRWEGRAAVSLMFADSHAAAGDAVCCAGMLAGAVLCTAHARVAARCEWVLNEKRLVERAGLDELQPVLARPGNTRPELAAGVAAVSAVLDIEPLAAR